MNTGEFNEFLSKKQLFDSNNRRILDRHFFEIRDGWLEFVKYLIEELLWNGWDGQISQCKEKFGGLRFYIELGDEIIWKIIDRYEKESFNICEICGEHGITMNMNNWLQVRCQNHKQ